MEIILKDGSYYEIDQNDLISWQRTYHECNVFHEINAAKEWCQANPSRRKTKRGAVSYTQLTLPTICSV